VKSLLRTGRRTLVDPGGFTLIELLVALAVAGVVLAGAYGWLWSVGALARAHDERAQASTIAAVAARTVAADVRAALAVLTPAPAHDPSRALLLAHRHNAAARELVLLVWDPSRRVLWRNASGTYVADHISGFSVWYRLDDGRTVAGAGMQSADWERVGGVEVDLTATVGRATRTRHAVVEVGP
jgi:prepilin-type N-terminal cleavage/methylation domain-containing protein